MAFPFSQRSCCWDQSQVSQAAGSSLQLSLGNNLLTIPGPGWSWGQEYPPGKTTHTPVFLPGGSWQRPDGLQSVERQKNLDRTGQLTLHFQVRGNRHETLVSSQNRSSCWSPKTLTGKVWHYQVIWLTMNWLTRWPDATSLMNSIPSCHALFMLFETFPIMSISCALHG